MLSFELLRNHAGITLWGDHHTLRVLHGVVHDLNERSPVIRDKEGWFLGLAYDVRKAYERQREISDGSGVEPDEGPRYGVKILWPTLLVQSRMLRVAMAFVDTDKRTQAIAYDLEHVIESALQREFPRTAAELAARWRQIDPAQPWAEEKASSRSAIFCSWTKAERAKLLSPLLASLDPLYPTMYKSWVRAGEKPPLAPDALDAWADVKEWPDPNW